MSSAFPTRISFDWNTSKIKCHLMNSSIRLTKMHRFRTLTIAKADGRFLPNSHWKNSWLHLLSVKYETNGLNLTQHVVVGRGGINGWPDQQQTTSQPSCRQKNLFWRDFLHLLDSRPRWPGVNLPFWEVFLLPRHVRSVGYQVETRHLLPLETHQACLPEFLWLEPVQPEHLQKQRPQA